MKDLFIHSLAFGIAMFIVIHVFLSTDDNQQDNEEAPVEIPASSIDKFDYSGHTYIKIKDGNDVQIVHDPDCECNDKNK